MIDITDKAKELFHCVKGITPDFFLAYYESRPKFHTYLYETNGLPFVFTFDENTGEAKSSNLSFSLPDTMNRLASLEKENEMLKKEIEIQR